MVWPAEYLVEKVKDDSRFPNSLATAGAADSAASLLHQLAKQGLRRNEQRVHECWPLCHPFFRLNASGVASTTLLHVNEAPHFRREEECTNRQQLLLRHLSARQFLLDPIRRDSTNSVLLEMLLHMQLEPLLHNQPPHVIAPESVASSLLELATSRHRERIPIAMHRVVEHLLADVQHPPLSADTPWAPLRNENSPSQSPGNQHEVLDADQTA